MKKIDRIDPRTGQRIQLGYWPETADKQFEQMVIHIRHLAAYMQVADLTGSIPSQVAGILREMSALVNDISQIKQFEIDDDPALRWPRWIVEFLDSAQALLTGIASDLDAAQESQYKKYLVRAMGHLREFDHLAKAGPGPDGELIGFIVIDPNHGFAAKK